MNLLERRADVLGNGRCCRCQPHGGDHRLRWSKVGCLSLAILRFQPDSQFDGHLADGILFPARSFDHLFK
jgi:hypothetical protein